MTGRMANAYDLFISYAEADRAWVEGYLLDALQAAGVRVHSEEAFRLGVPRLLEFERAVKDSQRVLLILSPAYLAEGFTQFTDLLAQSYGLETATWPVIPLILQRVELPTRLAMLESLDATEPEERDRALERLCAELQRPVPAPAPPPECPYPGMVPFRAEDARFFFGREGEIKELRQRLRNQALILVVGPSGSGKSSLVFGGLLPELAERQAGRWTVRDLRPGAQPVEALAQALGIAVWPGEAGMGAAVEAALEGVPQGQRLLLIVDQLEELFTQAAKAQQPGFFGALKALSQEGRCSVLLTMRADFFGDLMTSDLWPVDRGQQVQVTPLRGAALREAIVKPAEAVGVYLEEGLVERLLADAAEEPGVLPLVQETMVLLWEEMERRLIPLRAYEELGDEGQSGLAVAMRLKADAAWAALSAEGQGMARRIMLRLVQFGEGRADTRRQQVVAELRSSGDDATLFTQTLGHLSDNRLLTLSGGEGEAGVRVDLAHEGLIEGWPRLGEWITERREAELIRRRLEAKAAEWEGRRREGGLLDEVELGEAERWLASADAAELGGASDALEALAEASRDHLEQEEQRWRQLYQEAESQRRIAVSRQLAAQALVYQDRRLDLALLLAAEARRAHDTAEARSSLLSLLQSHPRLVRFQHGHAREPLSLAFGADGCVLATVQYGGPISLWDVATYGPLGEPLPDSEGVARSVALSADGRLLASGGWDGTLTLWDVASRRPLGLPFAGGPTAATPLAFSLDGKNLACGCGESAIGLWSVETRQLLRTFYIPRFGPILSLAFSPDGATLAAGSWRGCIALADVEGQSPVGEPLQSGGGEVRALAFSPDGSILASGSQGNTITLWKVPDRQIALSLSGHSTSVMGVGFGRHGSSLVSADSEGTVVVWDLASHFALGELLGVHQDQMTSVTFSPTGNTLASGDQRGMIMLWDAAARRPLAQRLTGHVDAVTSLSYSQDGRILASGDDTGFIALWDTSALRPLGQPWRSHTGRITCLLFSPDGTTLASAGPDVSVTLWDVATRQSICEEPADVRNDLAHATFNPNGETSTSRGLGRLIAFWEMLFETKASQAAMTRSVDQPHFAISPDSMAVAWGQDDGSVLLGDPTAAGPLDRLERGHTGCVTSVAFSPDGAILASGSEDRTIVLWDVATRQPLGEPLRGHDNTVLGLAFSGDGKLLASGGWDKRIIVWDVRAESWARRACAVANRNLSQAEWHRFLGRDQPYRRTCPSLPAGIGAPGP